MNRGGDRPSFRNSSSVPLAYLEQGEGRAVVLVHGSLTDARYWLRSQQLPHLARRYRVLAPSRRHNHPNPTRAETGYSVADDAEDLVAFIRGLDLGPVHLLGHSYGAYGSLLTVIQAPELVRSLVLAEPPIMRWLPEIPRGQGIWERFEERVWNPIIAAFREGGDAAGLDATARWAFGKPFAEIDADWQRDFEDAVREWRALAASDDAYPFVPFEQVAAVTVPTLVLSAGNNAGGLNDVIDEALAATIPRARRIVVPDVSHEMFLDAPEVVASHVTEFLATVS